MPTSISLLKVGSQAALESHPAGALPGRLPMGPHEVAVRSQGDTRVPPPGPGAHLPTHTNLKINFCTQDANPTFARNSEPHFRIFSNSNSGAPYFIARCERKIGRAIFHWHEKDDWRARNISLLVSELRKPIITLGREHERGWFFGHPRLRSCSPLSLRGCFST